MSTDVDLRGAPRKHVVKDDLKRFYRLEGEDAETMSQDDDDSDDDAEVAEAAKHDVKQKTDKGKGKKGGKKAAAKHGLSCLLKVVILQSHSLPVASPEPSASESDDETNGSDDDVSNDDSANDLGDLQDVDFRCV